MSTDGELVVVGGDRELAPFLEVRQVSTGRVVGTLYGHTGRIDGVKFTASTTIATAGSDGTFRFWNLANID
jgi:WD40 repeat protein